MYATGDDICYSPTRQNIVVQQPAINPLSAKKQKNTKSKFKIKKKGLI